MVIDKAGNIYGTTNGGGTSGVGTVFKLDKTGKETICTTSRATATARAAAPI
jgi:uncharacterized repeat protein (TIGR03803 family)